MFRELLTNLKPVRVDDFLGTHRTRSLAKAGSITLLQQAGNGLLTFASTVILSRLLPPEVFGVMAIVVLLQTFLITLSGEGFLEATIQMPDLTMAKLNGVFLLNAMLSAALGIVLMALGPLAARFYAEPRLLLICIVAGGLFVLQNAIQPYRTLLRRSMRTDVLLMVSVVPQFISLLVAVGLALAGYQVGALVGGMVASVLTGQGLLIYFVRWVPSVSLPGPELKDVIRYGMRSMGGTIASFISHNFQTLVLGKVANIADVGYFTRGKSLFQIPIRQFAGPLITMMFPAMSAAQGNRAHVLELVMRATWLVGLVLFPFACVALVFGDWVVLWLLGEKWIVAGEVLRWMAIAEVTGLFNVALPKANAAIGRPARAMWLSLATLPVLAGAVIASAPDGAVAVAQALAVVRWTFFPLFVWIYLRSSGFSALRFCAATIRLMILFGASVACLFALRWTMMPSSFVLRIIGVAMSYAVAVGIFYLGYRCWEPGRFVLEWLYTKFGRKCGLPRWVVPTSNPIES